MKKAVTPAAPFPRHPREAVTQERNRIHCELASVRKRLNRPATTLHRILAGANFLIALLRGGDQSEILDPDAVKKANRAFQRLFPPTLPEMTALALTDPEAYDERIRRYETACGSPHIPFETEADFYRLIVRDPIRKAEEYLLLQTALDCYHLNGSSFSVVDLGTGSGRLAFCLAETLSRLQASALIYGLDINSDNIRDALSEKSRQGYEAMKFVRGDMTRTPFAPARFSLANSSCSAYLVPFYRRPYQLLEMVRILQPGGTGIMTGPNENLSAWGYTLRMGASNLSTYLNPFNLAVALRLGPIGLLIDRTARRRNDFAYPVTSQVCAALRLLECDISRSENWPQSGGVGLFSAITFRTSEKTEQKIRNYRAFMEKVNLKARVAPI